MEYSQQDQPEKQNTDEESPASCGPALRILCLHDANSNAKELHEHIKELDKRLWEKHGIELVYVNSPLVVVKDQEHDANNNTRNNPPIRVWWQKSGEHEFLGLDASLLHLQQIYKSTPFVGIMAFGQGAQIGSILPPLLYPLLEFGIFVHGRSLMEDDVVMREGWPCLHIMKSHAVDDSSQRLLRQYPGQVHSSSNKTDSLLPEFNAIGKFIIQQKKRVVSSDTTCIVLQTQLHFLEQEASRLIAEQIAEDPPRALMAVIQPQSVGGWNRKRREFGAEGGGAPCPSDFLLRREKRAADPSGPSRHHPSANQDDDHEEEQSVDNPAE
jgi:hypothetical protein